ncbi:hypothetical protein ACWKSP_13040 [Micromonosporaceae bacterium Da 78-11]
MPRLTTTRVTALLGLAWLVLFIVGGPVLQGRPPSFDTPIAVLRAGFQAHGTRYLVGDLIAGCGFALCLLPFAALLPYALADRPGQLTPHPVWSRLTTAGAVAVAVTGGVATSFLDAAALAHGGPALDDSTLTALVAANAAGIALIGLPAAVLATSAAVLLWRGGARGAAVLGWVAAPLLVVGAAFPLGAAGGPLLTIRFAGFVVLAGFVLAASVTLLSRPAD